MSRNKDYRRKKTSKKSYNSKGNNKGNKVTKAMRGIMPNLLHSRQNSIVSAVSSSAYLTIIGRILDPDVLNANNGPQEDLETILKNAIEGFLTPTQLKDIVSADRDDGLDYITKVWSICQTLYAQLPIRQLCPAVVGKIDADGTTTQDIWLTDDIETFINEFSKVPIPSGVLEICRLLNPVIITSHPQPIRRYRGSHVLLNAPNMTISEAWTALGTLKTYTESGMYFAKTGIPLTKFSYNPIILDMVTTRNAYTDWLIRCNYVIRKNSADTGYFAISRGESIIGTEVLNANIFTDYYTSATWYTNVYMKSRPGEPFSDMYAFTRLFGMNDRTHNVVGIARQGASTGVDSIEAGLGVTTAGDTVLAAYVAHDGDSFTILSDANIEQLTPVIEALYTNATNQTINKLIGDGRTAIVSDGQIPYQAIEYAALSSTNQEDFERQFFAALMLQGKLPFAGI